MASFLIIFTILQSVEALSLFSSSRLLTKRDTFQWGVIGDSFASGVAYLESNTYDQNNGGCLRTTEAYGAQLEGDNRWQNGNTAVFDFAACSASKLGDMAHEGGQIIHTGSAPDLVIMTAGGNNAGFFGVADACVLHSTKGQNYGPNYADDTSRTGACAKAIDASTKYIKDQLGKDLKATMDDIFVADNVKANQDFLLYVTGYAAFFNLGDDWCNTHSFGVRSWPPLSHAVRNDMNELATKVNDVYRQTIQDYPNKNTRFLDIDPKFDGKRFCEANSSIYAQYFSADVWFWNLSPPWFTISQDADETEIHTEIQKAVGESEVSISGFGLGNVSEGWMKRPFHPKLAGHVAIKDVILDQMKEDKIPKSASESSSAAPSSTEPPPAPSSPPTPEPPYAKGTCSLHVDEYQVCDRDDNNLRAVVTIYDNDKTEIGKTPTDDTNRLGEPINDKDPYSMESKLSQPLIVIGEHRNDYIQLYLGDLSFTSRTTDGPATCHNGGWDPREGPFCSSRVGYTPSVSLHRPLPYEY